MGDGRRNGKAYYIMNFFCLVVVRHILFFLLFLGFIYYPHWSIMITTRDANWLKAIPLYPLSQMPRCSPAVFLFGSLFYCGYDRRQERKTREARLVQIMFSVYCMA